MHFRTVRTILILFGLAVLLVIVAHTRTTSSAVAGSNQAAHANAPAPTVQPATGVPAPTPIPSRQPLPPVPDAPPTAGLSPEAQQALAYIAKREDISAEQLVVVDEFPRPAPLLGRDFQAVTIAHQPTGAFFPVLADKASGQFEERSTEPVTVTIWAAAGNGQSIDQVQVAAFETLAAKYPAARAALARSGKPMDARIRHSPAILIRSMPGW